MGCWLRVFSSMDFLERGIDGVGMWRVGGLGVGGDELVGFGRG